MQKTIPPTFSSGLKTRKAFPETASVARAQLRVCARGASRSIFLQLALSAAVKNEKDETDEADVKEETGFAIHMSLLGESAGSNHSIKESVS